MIIQEMNLKRIKRILKKTKKKKIILKKIII